VAEIETNFDITNWLTRAKRKADWYDPSIEANDELLNDIDLNTLKSKT
jgi:hypothetical protein